MKLVCDRTAQALCDRCRVARTHRARLRGLLGRRELGPGEGLLLPSTWSVHTLLMRFPIDVVFLDRDMRVLSIRGGLRPWRASFHRGASGVLELAGGECERVGLVEGDAVRID
jgi:uncharacterized protein